jgi:hypothetical protein
MGKLQTLDELQAPPGGPAPAGGLASPVPAPVPKGAPPSGRNPDGSKRVISLDEMLPPPAPMFTGGNQRASVLAATPRDATFTSTAGTTGYDPSGLKKVLTAGVKDMQKDPHASDRLLDDVYRLTGNAANMDEAVEKGVGTPLAEAVAAARGIHGVVNEVWQGIHDTADQVPVLGKAVTLPMDAYDFVSKGFSSSLPSVLGAFDVLENVAWAGGAELGQLLPEGETAQNLAAQAGILASKAWKLNPAAPATEELLGLIDSAALGRMGVPVPSGRNANAEEHDRLVGEVAKRFYVALANGDIAKKAETHMMDQEYFGHKITNLTGTDLLDFAVSKEQAAELAERSESPSDRAFWTALTTTTGREVLGMAAEVVFDPLWFTGAAEGSKLVAAGDNLLRATGSVVADVGAMARHAKVDELHILTELARDADRATQTSLPLLQDIRASAQRALDEAKALAEQVATSPEGRGLAARAAKNLKVYENDIQRIDRVIGEVQGGTLTERIGKAGTGAYHLPFSHQTRYLFDAGGAAEQVLQRASAPVRALLAPIGAEIERLDKLADAVRYGQAPDSVLTAGNKVSLIVHTLAQTGRVARSVYDLPMLVFDILGRALGTRSFHTAYIPDLREVGSRLLPGSHLTQAADKAARPLGRKAAFGLARYVKGTNREEWARFVDGLAKATMANSVKDQDLMRDIFRLAEESERVWALRKKAQGSPGGVLQRIREMWKGKDYTSGNVLTEAFDLVERGAGEYEEYLKLHPEMKNVVGYADSLFKQVAANGQVGIEQARQALQSMARTMRGDFRRFDLFAQKVRQATEGIGDVWNDEPAARRALDDAAKLRKSTRQGAEAARTYAAQAEKEAQRAASEATRLRGIADNAESVAQAAEKYARDARDFAAAADAHLQAERATAAARHAESLAAKAAAAAEEAKAVAAEAAAKAAGAAAGGLDEAAAKATAVKVAAAVAKRDAYAQALKSVLHGKFFDAAAVAPEHLKRMLADGVLRTEAGGYRVHPEVLDALRGRAYTRHGSSAASAAAAAAEAAARTARAIADAAHATAAKAATVAADAIKNAHLAYQAARAARNEEARALTAAITARGNVKASEQAAIVALEEAQHAADRAASALRLSPDDATLQALKDAEAEVDKLLKGFKDEVSFRPELPTFDGSRPLYEWERDMWREYDAFTERVAPNDPDLRLQAAMLALREEATLPRDIQGVDKFAKDYAQILGKRFGDVPAELVPLVEMSRDLIRKYEGMYEAAGFDFMKKPAERMKSWGVVNFVPHILDEDAAIQKGKMLSNMGGGHFVAKTSLDARLSTGMDARRLREYAGTMSELNSSVTAGNRVFAINPHLLMARFMQGNRAVTAKGFLISLLQSGVAKAFTEGEADVNYVPLFNTHERTRAYDILLAGEQGAYKTLTPQEIDDGLRALRKRSPLKDADPFAAWVNEVPEMRQANVLERMVAEVNGERARAGLPLFTLPDKAAPLEEFEKFANDLNKDYYDMVARLGQPAEGASPLRTTGEWVRNYQQDGMRRLYVAADVYQNVVDSLDIAAQIVESPIIALPKAANDYINNFVKARLTVYRTAFHARNLLWNTFANILDLGPFGVFNVKTQVHANRLALLSSYFNKYGSLVEAEKVLGAARGPTEDALSYNTRWLKHRELRTVRDGLGLSDWQHVGLDLGDGIVRTVDDAMRILVDKGVITGAYTDFNDLARFEQGISDLYSKGGVKAVLAGLRRWAKRAEQAGYYGLAFTTAGVPGLMTLIPEKYGQALANYIENQTRLVNFIGNAKRTGSLTEAAAHVKKTLFHYDDLSAFQKVWMRSLFLFYSWNMKNLFFHAQMAIDRPAVYSQMYRLFVDNGPEILNSYFDESEGKHHIGGLARYTPYQEELVFDNERHKFRAPTGVKNTYVTGFGSPVEGALDQGAAIGEMLAGDPRLLGQSSAGIRMALESMFQRSFFYDKEWKDLNSGKPVGILLAGLNHTADQAEGQELSVLASALRTIARGLEVQTEFTAYRETNKTQRARVEDTRISPDAAYWMSELPQRAMLNDWAAYADAYHVALPEASSAAEGSAEGYQPVPFFWRVLDAMGGISLTQIDELRRRQQVQSDHDKAILEILVGRDHMTEYTTPAVKE